MKIIERDTKVIAYDEDLNEVIIQLIEDDDDGNEKLFIGSRKEWKNYAQTHSVVAL